MKRATLPFSLLLWAPLVFGQSPVVTYHYDNARTGQNIQEPFLTPACVKPDQFRRLFIQLVDGDVYAQPLYVPAVTMGAGTAQAGTKHNVVIVATEGDSVYAFDSDNRDGANANPLWQASLIDTKHGATAGATTVSSVGDVGCDDINPQYGITSTPAIDLGTGTMYVVALSKENGSLIYRLHALDITTGNEKAATPPVIINATGSGTSFDAARHHNRPGLLLASGTIYVAFGSHCDNTPFHGWIFAFDAATLAQRNVLVTTPKGTDGGIWMEGAGLAADTGGNLFVATGNGTFDTIFDARGFPVNKDFGDSILKLDRNLAVLDYFTPFNQDWMNGNDQDLGSGGVLLLPDQPGNHPHLLTQAGKEGRIYLIDRDQMTSGNQHFCSGCSSDKNVIVQELQKPPIDFGVLNTPVPVYWNNSVYFRGDQDVLKAFSLNSGQLGTPPLQTPPSDTYSGRISISANGDSNGIVWSLNASAVTTGVSTGPAILNAYDAVSLSQLYSSAWAGNNGNPGGAVKFTSPVVANGKVYVGTSGQLAVFSLYGIGGYDLGSGVDHSFPFDYDGSGKLDHLALYRPGTGTIWILKNSAGTFTPVYQQGDPGSGIGGFDLKSLADRAFAFDYDGSGKLDHLVLYRPGAGTIWILKNSAGIFTPVYQQGDPGSGIGGFDLKSLADRAFAFDYDGSGKLDHLVLYRPGTGTIWILRNDAGAFTPVYQQGGSGIGGYDLKSAADQAFAFDYDGSGKLDHLALYRPGTGTIWILRNDAGAFTPVYQQGGNGIGGYDLKSAADQAFAFDYDGSGKLDHLALYRPGTGTISILTGSGGGFVQKYAAW
jgi:hypothetical protein